LDREAAAAGSGEDYGWGGVGGAEEAVNKDRLGDGKWQCEKIRLLMYQHGLTSIFGLSMWDTS